MFVSVPPVCWPPLLSLRRCRAALRTNRLTGVPRIHHLEPHTLYYICLIHVDTHMHTHKHTHSLHFNFLCSNSTAADLQYLASWWKQPWSLRTVLTLKHKLRLAGITHWSRSNVDNLISALSRCPSLVLLALYVSIFLSGKCLTSSKNQWPLCQFITLWCLRQGPEVVG